MHLQDQRFLEVFHIQGTIVVLVVFAEDFGLKCRVKRRGVSPFLIRTQTLERTKIIRLRLYYREHLHPEHHSEKTFIEDLSGDIVRKVPPEGLHLFDLGATKRFLLFVLKFKGNARMKKKIEK